MKLGNECRSCLFFSQSKKVENYNAEERDKFISEIKELCEREEENSASPLLMRRINLLHQEIFGKSIDYKEEKIKFNSLCLSYENDIYDIILNSSDSLEKAIQFAIVGNLIDFTKLTSIDMDLLEYFVSKANEQKLDEVVLSELKKDLSSAKTITYLLDNCGEIVFDKLLIKTIKKLYPHVTITAVVRGEEIVNDVTYFDSSFVGLDKVCDVIDNGTNVPGTYLKEISKECLHQMNSSDVIISKGLGNFETLHNECDYNIYYLFLCKCDFFASMFNVKVWDSVLTREKKI